MTESQTATLQRLQREQVAFPPVYACSDDCVRVMLIVSFAQRRSGPLAAMEHALPTSFEGELVEIDPNGVARTVESGTYELTKLRGP